MSIKDPTEIEYCIYCGRDGKTIDCNCKQATWDRARNIKPVSAKARVVYKSLGFCPKCRSVITPNDVNQLLKVECKSCGTTEDYHVVKAGAWKKLRPIVYGI